MNNLLKKLRKQIEKDCPCYKIKLAKHVSPLCAACQVVSALRTLEEFYLDYTNKTHNRIIK